MSNSSLVTYTKLSPNHSGKRSHIIDTISIHCMAGNLSVESCGNIFANPARKASSNYGIGSDGRIALYVDEANRSWCTSSSSNDNRAITIEVANTVAADPWPVSDKAYASLIELLVDICKRNNIKTLLWKADKSLIGQINKQNMTVHRWFAAKSCPGDWLYDRHDQIAEEVNKRLNLNMEDDDMNIERFKELWFELRKELRDNDSASWSEEARTWATEIGLIAGGGTGDDGNPNYMWEDLLTREQFVTVLYRFAQLMGKA
ncbi:MAG: peptidoglycan recognition family protein [Fermentimonas sp.]|nr:peptidoglycan recognition family protein [Fermentimonas sp.]